MRGRGRVLLGVLSGLTGAARARAEPAGLEACFGGVPETVVGDAGKVEGLRIDPRYLYWNDHRMELATRAVGVDPTDRDAVSDGREAFFVTDMNDLLAREIATGKTRLIYGAKRIEDAAETIVPASGHRRLRGPVRVAAERVYYLDDQSIWSVPADGRGPFNQEAALAGEVVEDLVVVPPCLYWATGRAIRRARLAGAPRASQVIGNERSDAGNIVSDGRFLYWSDARTGRIVRAAPSAGTSVPPLPAPVITRAPAQNIRPPHLEALAIGEGWGCARARENRDAAWYCWEAPGRRAVPGTPRSPAIVAKKVPWLTNVPLQVGPHRACALVGDETRCWSVAALLRADRPAELPSRERIGGPRAAASDTISCTSVAHEGYAAHGWRCAGDARTGPTMVEAKAPPYVSNTPIALGRWHGCIGSGELACWGRGDGGQLGVPAKERCGSPGHQIACAKTPQPVPFSPKGDLRAGDMYTCVASAGPLVCWGASRDGLFGTAAACPPKLRKAWPTGSGTVPAPAATCAAAPVNVPGFKHGSFETSVGPRGICAQVQGHLRCMGAIRAPAVDAVAAWVSPGDDASACGVYENAVVCWGERYSPADDPTAPVEIALDTTGPAGLPVVDSPAPPGAAWDDACGIHFGCQRTIEPLPACAPGKGGRPWSALEANAETLRGDTIEVRGQLLVGPAARHTGPVDVITGVVPPAAPRSCGAGRCCNEETRPLVVADDAGGASAGLLLTGFDCRGDDSRVCCNTPASGQEVIATGRLTGTWGSWRLAPAALCVVPPRH